MTDHDIKRIMAALRGIDFYVPETGTVYALDAEHTIRSLDLGADEQAALYAIGRATDCDDRGPGVVVLINAEYELRKAGGAR